jgi:hypothetical protein
MRNRTKNHPTRAKKRDLRRRKRSLKRKKRKRKSWRIPRRSLRRVSTYFSAIEAVLSRFNGGTREYGSIASLRSISWFVD